MLFVPQSARARLALWAILIVLSALLLTRSSTTPEWRETVTQQVAQNILRPAKGLIESHAGLKTEAPELPLKSGLPAAGSATQSAPFPSATAHLLASHPIQVLSSQASEAFAEMLHRQSTTFEAAVTTYEARYRRAPPPGFDKWFAYAQSQGAPIIDDYDTIADSLSLFWHEDPSRCHELLKDAAGQTAMSNLTIKNGNYTWGEEIWGIDDITRWMENVMAELPDVTILVNGFDEPRVIPASSKSAAAMQEQELFQDGAHKPAWGMAIESCPDDSPATTDRPIKGRYELPFVEDIKAAMDLCQHPEYKDMHGMLIAPATLDYTRQPVPVMSQTAPSTFGDILFPSPYYWHETDSELDEHDPAWEEKKNLLYWVGSTTGGHSGASWQNQHRQRFVAATSQLLNQTATFLTQTEAGEWATYQSTEILSQLYHTKFGNICQCDEAECAAETAFFGEPAPEDGENKYKSRFVMDLDGNSFSGRYYNLLASRSAVFKQTILREWHDDRLIPWLHYVPVSLSFEELPETMRYLALTHEGDLVARRIAEAGRDWTAKALREADAKVYMYRLLLEYARVFDVNRDETVLG